MGNGKIIAAFGIPGSGKSTTTREIGKLLGVKTFHEPEEEDWGEVVKLRHMVGNFNAIMWFRSIRLPHYHLANELRSKGQVCMMDSFYDKLFYLYHNKPGLEWLFSKTDDYYDEMVKISKKDYEILPDADVIIFFKQSENNWRRFLKSRNRDLDNESDFKTSFTLQNAFIDAVDEYCNRSKCKLIIHDQIFSDPRTEAEKIVTQLKKLIS